MNAAHSSIVEPPHASGTVCLHVFHCTALVEADVHLRRIDFTSQTVDALTQPPVSQGTGGLSYCKWRDAVECQCNNKDAVFSLSRLVLLGAPGHPLFQHILSTALLLLTCRSDPVAVLIRRYWPVFLLYLQRWLQKAWTPRTEMLPNVSLCVSNL